jgi:ABC-type branched-subunit amino acid transport system permease subunit
MRLKLALEVLALLALAVLVAVLPRFVSSFTAYELATVGMYFIALLGLSILTGYSGQISLGHGAFMAVGGYTTAVLSVNGVYGHTSATSGRSRSPVSSQAAQVCSSGSRRSASPVSTWR